MTQEFKPGDRVRHAQHGAGTVTQMWTLPNSEQTKYYDVDWDSRARSEVLLVTGDTLEPISNAPDAERDKLMNTIASTHVTKQAEALIRDVLTRVRSLNEDCGVPGCEADV